MLINTELFSNVSGLGLIHCGLGLKQFFGLEQQAAPAAVDQYLPPVPRLQQTDGHPTVTQTLPMQAALSSPHFIIPACYKELRIGWGFGTPPR